MCHIDGHGEGRRRSTRANVIPPPPCFHGLELSLLLERGTHQQPSAECLAPFHQDRTQQIAMVFMRSFGFLVFPVGALLRLADDREGSKIGWDEWKIHTATPSTLELYLFEFCVSGCRLFFVTSGPNVEVEVYDFSIQGRAKYLSEQVNADLGGEISGVHRNECVIPRVHHRTI